LDGGGDGRSLDSSRNSTLDEELLQENVPKLLTHGSTITATFNNLPDENVQVYTRKTSPSKQDLHGKDSLGAISLATARAESFTDLLQCHECIDEDSDEYDKGLGGLALAPLTQDPSPSTISSTRISKTNKTVNFDEDIPRTASYMNANGFNSGLPAVEQSPDMISGLTRAQLATADISELANNPTEWSLVPLALKPLAEWNTVKKLKTPILVHRLNTHGVTVHAKHTRPTECYKNSGKRLERRNLLL
jgi:hypothetical protein